MLLLATNIMGRHIEAEDGALGVAQDIYFDDEQWTVRWLVVDVGSWLSGRRVLVSPVQAGPVDPLAGTLSVGLTKAQARGAPSYDTDLPVALQQQRDLAQYYELMACPDTLGIAAPMFLQPAPLAAAAEDDQPGDDPRLRSMRELLKYTALARDGVIGTVKDFLIHPRWWTVEALGIKRKDAPSHVLLAARKVVDISWKSRQVRFVFAQADIPSNVPSEIVG